MPEKNLMSANCIAKKEKKKGKSVRIIKYIQYKIRPIAIPQPELNHATQ
jgi:hypothetical protein